MRLSWSLLTFTQTTLAAQLIRDPDVGAAFECLLWVSVSAEPNVLQLLRVLYSQLTQSKMPASIDEERDAVQEVSRVAKGIKALWALSCSKPPAHPLSRTHTHAHARRPCTVRLLS